MAIFRTLIGKTAFGFLVSTATVGTTAAVTTHYRTSSLSASSSETPEAAPQPQALEAPKAVPGQPVQVDNFVMEDQELGEYWEWDYGQPLTQDQVEESLGNFIRSNFKEVAEELGVTLDKNDLDEVVDEIVSQFKEFTADDDLEEDQKLNTEEQGETEGSEESTEIVEV